jgi:hypothetical protein
MEGLKVEIFFCFLKKHLYKNFTYKLITIAIFIFLPLINPYSIEFSVKNINSLQNIFNNDSEEVLVNFPNPFSSFTFIYVSLPQKSDCELKIYDLFGNLVKEFNLSGEQRYLLVWDGTNNNSKKISNGGYICVLKYGSKKLIRKIGYTK